MVSCLCSWARRVRLGHTWEGDLVGVKGTVGWAGCPWGASFSPTRVPPGSPHPSSLWSLLPGFPRDKPKLSPRQWDARDTGRLLSRPQSAGSSLSQPGMTLSGHQGRERAPCCLPVGGGEQGSVPPAGQGGMGVWGGMGRGGSRMEGEDWQMGQLDPVLEPERGGERGGLVSVGQQPVCFRVGARTPFLGVWPGRCPCCLPRPGLAELPTASACPIGCRGANPCPSPPGTAASLEHRPASSHGHLSQAPGLFPPLQDGSSTLAAGWDRGSPAKPPPPQLPSRRASGSGQQQ